ncbi:hypothetical protein HMPREF1544_00408 [Mucor circinelloides 1006PhL]|uniref:Uncharacterized protein n=1 Tax=Mucor circinelloides f. circinelloides (strain 1006PhL) TaxID=1220926 RepID=S2JRP7_MUCC1|nr:hypothetical protein HMPREF1544_00408 [Mucor circinelloides 1006PhL]KAG1073343.1 hypothetical protein G6F42_025822 [Rhizopus arrhizus]
MLRVYSVLYIERLWSDDPTVSSQKNLIQSSNSSTHSQIIVTDAYATRDIQADDIADVASVQNSDEEQEDHQESPEEAPSQDSPTFVQVPETALEETEMLDSKVDSETSVDSTVPQQPQEHIVNSLAIDTNNLQNHSSSSAAVDAQAEAQAEAMSITTTPVAVAERSADHHPTSISSSSSILPPLTPSSVHSIGANDAFEKPRTTSLIRRETQKINDRRKSLTKKLKRVLTVKSENKRNSV